MEYTKYGNFQGLRGLHELWQGPKKNVSRGKVVIASKVYFNPGRLSREAIHREIDGPLPSAAIKNNKY